ncbi:MAG: AbrB/MazE/SpoVT family DNA-binding domain-containing protein [Dehalococcoidales bacterium]|nr:AbrB/MazE/SpoVT family DNA-binding domain-containing protein [Dehalococcoidales bacterium]
MPIPDERSLFKTGESLAVTLPKAWIKYFHLKAGDQVEIVVGEDLAIRAKKRQSE